ncbi:glycosyltransferase [Bacillus sp. ISL-40]|uniref:glycosyltransferase n=1 Tax=unclassified Bacillus (in: firmicutes) TaxID=185979 RepID=UPI001BE56A94|nr:MULTISPECIES: glycosyltransferase [unclassified Bacillus (in: firmicutes)]MBT2699452.1 glycosyltransferase [Bacillus sp. ISL-40]MBT2721982.1 glycosyltransferase [Bacillus sp. ISL-46]MBT2741669.1 glycosyltransferase [Bacillus sp. ISL-77]
MKKNILISVYNMEIGGIERSLINMLESFDYEKYNVDLLIFHHVGDFMKLIPKSVNILPEVEKFTVFRKPVIQCLKEGHYSLALMRIIAKYIAEIKSKTWKLTEGAGYIQMQLSLKYSTYFIPRIEKEYDVAISYAWPHDIIANKVNAQKKIAWIHTDYSKLEIDNRLDLNVWNKFDAIASVSDACATSFLATYPSLKEKVKVIENLTSPTFIKKMAEEIKIFNNCNQTFNIVSVGRLSYVKGFDLAISALRVLHDKGLTNIKWYVIGYGGFETDLKELITKNNLEDSFILLGKQTNPYPYIKDCDLYVQPSRYEGKAVTVSEAKILGKPILITSYPTASSQIENGVEGIICDLSVDGIVNGIEGFHQSEELRNSFIRNIIEIDYSNNYELEKLYKIVG